MDCHFKSANADLRVHGFRLRHAAVSIDSAGARVAAGLGCIPRRNRSICPSWVALHLEVLVGTANGPRYVAARPASRVDAAGPSCFDRDDRFVGKC